MANIIKKIANKIIGKNEADDIKPSVNLTDDELISLSDKWLNESSEFYDYLKKIWDVNEQYYLGNQTKKSEIPSHKCDAVENRIFEGVETVVPIAVANTPQWVCLPANENELSAKLSDSIQEILKARYEARDVDAKEKLRMVVRHNIIYRLGILKPYWDESVDDWNFKAIRPQRIRIPKYGMSEDDLPYIIEKIDMGYDEIENIWGKEGLEKAKKSGGRKDDDESSKLSRTAMIYEIWTDEFVFWRCGSEIIDKMPNPYFDFTGRKEEGVDEFGNNVVRDVFYNHFRKPRKPYIFLSTFRLGKSVVGETDLITQGIPIQDVINTLTRQIVNNAKKMGNSAWFVDSDVMTEEDAKNNITNEEGIILYGSGAADPNKMRREAPPPLPEYIPVTRIQANQAFDNIFGTHATTRGERSSPETLGGRMLLKQADLGRGGTFVDELDRAVAELGNWGLQMMKMYYEKEKTIRLYGSNGVSFLQFSRDNIEDGVELIVKAGSTLQQDELSQRNETLILWQNGALDPITLYERLKYPNPQELASRLVKWKMGQLLPEQQALATQGAVPPEGEPAMPAGNPEQVNPAMNPQQEIGEATAKLVSGGV